MSDNSEVFASSVQLWILLAEFKASEFVVHVQANESDILHQKIVGFVESMDGYSKASANKSTFSYHEARVAFCRGKIIELHEFFAKHNIDVSRQIAEAMKHSFSITLEGVSDGTFQSALQLSRYALGNPEIVCRFMKEISYADEVFIPDSDQAKLVSSWMYLAQPRSQFHTSTAMRELIEVARGFDTILKLYAGTTAALIGAVYDTARVLVRQNTPDVDCSILDISPSEIESLIGQPYAFDAAPDTDVYAFKGEKNVLSRTKRGTPKIKE